MRSFATGGGFVCLLAVSLGGLSGCSSQPAENPVQTPMPELTVSAIREGVIAGMQCEVAGTITNRGPIPVRHAEFRLVQHYESRLEIISALPPDDWAVGESRPFRIVYACGRLVGARAFRGSIGDLPVRVIER